MIYDSKMYDSKEMNIKTSTSSLLNYLLSLVIHSSQELRKKTFKKEVE